MYSIAALSHKITLHGIQLTQPHDNIRIDCRAWWEVKQKIEIAIAVIQSKIGEVTHWALTHCGTQADFHQRESFTFKL